MRLIFAFIFFSLASLGSTQTNLFTEDFETNGSGSRYSVVNEFHDGSNDYFTRTDGANPNISIRQGDYTDMNGSFYFAGEDLDDNGGNGNTTGTITFSSIDITNYTNLSFSGLFAYGGVIDDDWDAGELVYVEYSIDNGPWIKIVQFAASGSSFNNNLNEDTNFDGLGDGVALDRSFSEFTKQIPSTGTSMDLRFFAEANSADEEFAVDYLRIEGDLVAACSATTNTALPSSDQLLDATHTCDEGGWTYYAASAAGPYLFAINWAPDGSISAANQTAKDNVLIEIDANSPQAVVLPGVAGTWTMDRFWNVATDPIDENVGIRFFYDLVEKNATTDAASDSGFTPVETPVWFKTTTSDFSPTMSVSATGIGGNAIDLTNNIVSDGMTLGGTTYVEFEDISSFSGGTWAAGAGTVGAQNSLPVEFADVTARRTDDNHVEVSWETSIEVNNEYFEVQHSSNGIDFDAVGIIEGAGNSERANTYSLEHATPVKGINYYRIAQYDFDGSVGYSSTVSIQMGEALELQLRPTIVENELTYDVGDRPAKMIIMSLDGSMYREIYIDGQGQLDCTDLQPGLYTITVVTGLQSVTKRITKI